jgi:nitrite reductase/ring-hydroxylating ferredoxin subunit
VTSAPLAAERFAPVLPAADLQEGVPTAVDAEGLAVCLVRLADRVVAFEDRCPHRGTPLSRGWLDGTTLTCAAHTWEFDVRTGELLRLRAPACLTMLAVRERDGTLEVGVPA